MRTYTGPFRTKFKKESAFNSTVIRIINIKQNYDVFKKG